MAKSPRNSTAKMLSPKLNTDPGEKGRRGGVRGRWKLSMSAM